MIFPWYVRMLLVACLAVAAGAAGYFKGARAVQDKWDLAQARQTAAVEADYGARLAAARTREQALQELFDRESAQRHQEETQHAQDLAAWRARVRTGEQRLSIAVASARKTGSAGADTDTGAGAGSSARADVLPATADIVLSIAADDARLVRDYNRLLARFHQARDVCNEPIGAGK